MRSDYALYAVAIICFIISGVSAAYTASLWTVTPVVFGFVFIGLGYTLRPKRAVTTQIAVAPPPPSVVAAPTPKVTEVVEEKKPVETRPEPVVQAEPVVEVKPPSAGLLEVKGIGEKRAEQLRTLGVSTVEDLATASAKDLATKLKISPKITGKWIENAKGIVGKPR
ncbi:MAG: helix-hairpin-helix domain-containing protein [Candidatus Bathyarchaeia archaeon]